jgi:hypothetical protein
MVASACIMGGLRGSRGFLRERDALPGARVLHNQQTFKLAAKFALRFSHV